MRVRTDDGREFIDAIGGAIVSGLGCSNETVRAAMHASIDRLDYWPVLHGTTPAALRLARRLAELLRRSRYRLPAERWIGSDRDRDEWRAGTTRTSAAPGGSR